MQWGVQHAETVVGMWLIVAMSAATGAIFGIRLLEPLRVIGGSRFTWRSASGPT